MPTYESRNNNYGPISGADKFVYEGDVVEGDIPKNRLHHFRLLDEKEAATVEPINDLAHETEEVQKWLKAHNVDFSGLADLETLRGIKVDAEQRLNDFKTGKAPEPTAPADPDEVEKAELKAWLTENGVSFKPNTGVVKLREKKADKEEELTAPDSE